MMIVLLLVLGGVLGSIANWAIYQCGYFQTRPFSPLGPRDPLASPRRWWDYLPVFGWLALRRDETVHGRLFWLRPFLIECCMAFSAVAYYEWLERGGILGFQGNAKAAEIDIWFAAHLLLFTLLTIATFIDFDERTIPDWITIPGTIAGLVFAISAPGVRLPEFALIANGNNYQALTFVSPDDLASVFWFRDWRGLVSGWLIVWIWVFALLPKTIEWRWGIGRGLKYMLASIRRPRHRRTCSVRTRERSPFGFTWLLIGVGVGLSILVLVGRLIEGETWNSLMGSLLGLAFAGAMVWAVRIVAGYALQQEAMGFGDVTLMAMIGTFVGWQASLLVFALAPFAALVIALSQYVLSRNRELAFGPYLALAAVFLIVAWHWVWHAWARNGLFQNIQLLLIVLAVALVLFGLMLVGVRGLKRLSGDTV